jgi:hypothetical protein
MKRYRGLQGEIKLSIFFIFAEIMEDFFFYSSLKISLRPIVSQDLG